MSDGLLTISLLVVAGIVCLVLMRMVAARRVQARQARLKEHLDRTPPERKGRRLPPLRPAWVNPP